jgi:hypothetical protein
VFVGRSFSAPKGKQHVFGLHSQLQPLWVVDYTEKTFEESDATNDTLALIYRRFQLEWRKNSSHIKLKVIVAGGFGFIYSSH